MFLNVSWRELSAWMNFASSRCCQSAGVQELEQASLASVVPWLEPAIPMTSRTSLRVSGQKRSDQRMTMPPWEWPMMPMRRPESWRTRRIA